MRHSKRRRIEDKKRAQRAELVNKYNKALNELGKDAVITLHWAKKLFEFDEAN